MTDCDVLHMRPLSVAIELTGSGWIDMTARTDATQDRAIVRIQAADLRDAQRQTATIRSTTAEQGRDPADVTVLVDIEVVTAPESQVARTELARLDRTLNSPRVPRSLLYVGTPTGLAGLIADMHAVNVADGVTLLPLVLPGALDDIVCESLPWLQTVGFELSLEKVEFIRQRILSYHGGDAPLWGQRRYQTA